MKKYEGLIETTIGAVEADSEAEARYKILLKLLGMLVEDERLLEVFVSSEQGDR